MGQFLAKTMDQPNLVHDPLLVQYRKVNHSQIYESLEILNDVHNGKHALGEEEFDEVFGFWLGDSEPHFWFWANRKGKVDCFETFCGTIVYAEGPFEDKVNFIFNFFDFDHSDSISIDELTILIMSSVRGMCRLVGMPITLDADFMQGVERIARSAFLQMDTDKSRTISKQEFAEWVLNNQTIMDYVQTFSGGTNIFAAIDAHKQLMARSVVLFERQMHEDRTCSPAQIADVMRQVMREPTEDEIKYICSALDDRVTFEVFTHLMSALMSFDIMDKNQTRSLDIHELRGLLWLVHGKEPSNKMVESEMAQLDEDKSGEISRHEFVKYMTINTGGENNRIKLDIGLRKVFNHYDTQGIGAIRGDDFSNMIREIISEQVGDHITEFGRSMLNAVSQDVATDLIGLIDTNGNSTLEWNEIKKYTHIIYEKQRELMEWLKEYQTNHISRIAAFDKDGSSAIELNEMQQMLMDNLKMHVKYRQITLETAMQLTTQTAKKIFKAFGQTAKGSISYNDLNAHYSKVVKHEKEMMAELARLLTPTTACALITDQPPDSRSPSPAPAPVPTPANPAQSPPSRSSAPSPAPSPSAAASPSPSPSPPSPSPSPVPASSPSPAPSASASSSANSSPSNARVQSRAQPRSAASTPTPEPDSTAKKSSAAKKSTAASSTSSGAKKKPAASSSEKKAKKT